MAREQIGVFAELVTVDIEELRRTVQRASAEGFLEFERLTRQQMAA
ncbi:MAG TPA: hypothetical protein VGN88_07800 [Phycisphaerae bacterium]